MTRCFSSVCERATTTLTPSVGTRGSRVQDGRPQSGTWFSVAGLLFYSRSYGSYPTPPDPMYVLHVLHSPRRYTGGVLSPEVRLPPPVRYQDSVLVHPRSPWCPSLLPHSYSSVRPLRSSLSVAPAPEVENKVHSGPDSLPRPVPSLYWTEPTSVQGRPTSHLLPDVFHSCLRVSPPLPLPGPSSVPLSPPLFRVSLRPVLSSRSPKRLPNRFLTFPCRLGSREVVNSSGPPGPSTTVLPTWPVYHSPTRPTRLPQSYTPRVFGSVYEEGE